MSRTAIEPGSIYPGQRQDDADRYDRSMARFYLDLHQCGDVTLDEEGVDLADLAAARARAIASARDVMIGELSGGHLCLGCAIAIRDESGATVLAVPFTEAVAVTFAGGC